ncbi:MAG: tyrosine-type recombinase/integrase [Chloroflexi bacterium]|nr:tyrosine-type recombinase/integrase [Chloroflexota bacterium]
MPRSVFTTDEVEAVLAVPDITKPNGLRDRALLETLYSSGLRRMEIINLGLYDVDRSRGTLMVRQGKGRKDRVVPIGERALKWIEKYLAESRPLLSNEMGDGPLFVTKPGKKFHQSTLTHLITRYINKAEIGKTGSCHSFRHSMATAMLEGGAGLRYVQAMLGHGDLSSTQVYTHVSIAQLKAVHEQTHPARIGQQD